MAKNKVDKNQIFQVVVRNIKKLLQTTNRNEGEEMRELTGEINIFDDLGVDSVEVMDLLGMIEKELETTFQIDEFGHRKTIKDVVEFISEQLSERNT